MANLPLYTRQQRNSLSVPGYNVSEGSAEIGRALQSIGKQGENLATNLLEKRVAARNLMDSKDKMFNLKKGWIDKDKFLISKRLGNGNMDTSYGTKEDGSQYTYDEAVEKDLNGLIEKVSENSVSETAKEMYMSTAKQYKEDKFIKAAADTYKMFNKAMDDKEVEEEESIAKNYQSTLDMEALKTEYAEHIKGIWEKKELGIYNQPTAQLKADSSRERLRTNFLDTTVTAQEWGKLSAALISTTMPKWVNKGSDQQAMYAETNEYFFDTAKSPIRGMTKEMIDGETDLTKSEKELLTKKIFTEMDSSRLSRDYLITDLMKGMKPEDVTKYTRILLRGIKDKHVEGLNSFKRDVVSAVDIANHGQGSSVPNFSGRVQALKQLAPKYQKDKELKETLVTLTTLEDMDRKAKNIANVPIAQREAVIKSTVKSIPNYEKIVNENYPELKKVDLGLSGWRSAIDQSSLLKAASDKNINELHDDPAGTIIKNNPNIARAKTYEERTKRISDSLTKLGINPVQHRYTTKQEQELWDEEIKALDTDAAQEFVKGLRESFGSNYEALNREVLGSKSAGEFLTLSFIAQGDNATYIANLMRNKESIEARNKAFSSGVVGGAVNNLKLEYEMEFMKDFDKFKKASVFEFNRSEREAAVGKVDNMIRQAIKMHVNDGLGFDAAGTTAEKKIISDNFKFVKHKDNYIMLGIKDPIKESEVETFVNEVDTGEDLVRLGAVPSKRIMEVMEAKVGLDYLKPSEKVREAYNALASQAQYARSRDGKGLMMYVYNSKEFRYEPLMSKADRNKVLVIPWEVIKGNPKVLDGEKAKWWEKSW